MKILNLARGPILASYLFIAWPALAGEPNVEQLIQQAGNADDDAERLATLRQLQAVADLDPELRTDVDRIEKFVDRWVNDSQLFQWFHRQIRDKLDYDMGIPRLCRPVTGDRI